MTNDEQVECPLCMEILEIDDISFYPCICGYQICRFCWHRLKTDGNGLCPACRKAYSENPAHFEPLSEDEIIRIKKERRQKELQKKQKLSENRRHLSDVRVVQKNLVFIVGLSQRLADQEVLKKQEYFGKFGKILKVVINPSPSYAGTQMPSASAYVTYSKADEALRAIQSVNNIQLDNRTLKASLGTTKYCSHFLKSTHCPKTDCMYLHDFGEDAASFTKDEMSQGKHLEYESKLIETILHIPRSMQNISIGDLSSSNQSSNNQQSSSLNLNNDQTIHKSNDNLVNCVNTPNSIDETKQKLSLNNDHKIDQISKEEDISEFNKYCHIQNEQNSKDVDNFNKDHRINDFDFDSSCRMETVPSEKYENIESIKSETNEINTEAFSKNNNLIYINQEFYNKQFQEEDLGFDPWRESTNALQDLMKIEKTNGSIEDVMNNHLKNSSSIDLPKNLLSTNKSLINHIEFLQKQFLANQYRSLENFSCDQFSNLNEFLKTRSNNQASFVNINEDSSLVNKNFNDQEYKSGIQNLNTLNKINESNINDTINKNHIFQNVQLNNNTNNNHNSSLKNSLTSKNTNPVIPPPGFSINPNSMNIPTLNQTHYLASSSTGSVSSSNSSSLNNSASSTPAIIQVSALKPIGKLPQSLSLLNEKPSEEFKSSNSNTKCNEIDTNYNADRSELSGEKNVFLAENCYGDMNLTENRNLKIDSVNEQSFTNKLHKTLKSILPNANISFGNYNNNNINNNNNNNNNNNKLSNHYATSNLKENEVNQLWPDDPAIVSLTDRFNSNSTITNLSSLGSLLGNSNIHYSNYLNQSLLVNKNQNDSPLSTNFYNSYSGIGRKTNSNDINHSINNSEKNSKEISSNDKNNNQHINKFLDETENKSHFNMHKNFNTNTSVMKKEMQINENENEILEVNKNQQINIIKNLNANLCTANVNNHNDLFFNYGADNPYGFLNQSNNMNPVNNLSLQQQLFIQQLTSNLSCNKKLSTEIKK